MKTLVKVWWRHFIIADLSVSIIMTSLFARVFPGLQFSLDQAAYLVAIAIAPVSIYLGFLSLEGGRNKIRRLRASPMYRHIISVLIAYPVLFSVVAYVASAIREPIVSALAYALCAVMIIRITPILFLTLKLLR